MRSHGKVTRERRSGAASCRRSVRLLVAATTAASLWFVPQATAASAQAQRSGTRVPAATAAITAHDNKFWAGSNPIKFRGLNIIPPCCSSYWFDQLAGYKMNFVRIRFHWDELEPTKPKLVGSTWQHTWNQ